MSRLIVLFFGFCLVLCSNIAQAQDWEVVYEQDFNGINAFSEIPNVAHSPSFSLQINSGESGSSDKAAFTSYFYEGAASYVAFWFDDFSTQYEYRIQCKAKSVQSNTLQLQFRYNSQAGHLGIDIGSPIMIPQGTTGQVLISEPISELSGENYIILAPATGNNPLPVFLDDFKLERRLLNNTTTSIAFSSASETIPEGGSVEVCLDITSPSATQATTVEVALADGTSPSPHFDDFTAQTLTFPANSSDQECFTLQADADNGEEDQNTEYIFELINLNGEGTPEVGEPGILTVTVEDGGVAECEGFAGPDHEICQGESVTLGCDSNPEEYCYKWEPEEGLDSPYSSSTLATPNTTTVYTVHVTDDDGNYYGSDEVTVEVGFSVDLAEVNSICLGDNLTLSPVITGGSSNFSFSWSTDESTQSIVVSPMESTVYELTVTDGDGECVVQVSTLVEVREMPDLFITADYPSICELAEPSLKLAPPKNKSNNSGACDNSSTTLHTNLEGNYSYLWSTGEITSSISAEEVGLYSVTITDNQSGCTETASFEVHSCLQVAISSSIQTNNGQIEYLLEVEAPPGSSFEWEDGSTDNPRTVLEPGNYTVTVTTLGDDCVISKSHLIALPCTMPEDGFLYTPAHVGIFVEEGALIQFDNENGQLHALMQEGTKYSSGFNTSGDFSGYEQSVDLNLPSIYSAIPSIPIKEQNAAILGKTEKDENGDCKCIFYKMEVPISDFISTNDGTWDTPNTAMDLELPSASINPYLIADANSAVFCASVDPNGNVDLTTILDLLLDNAAINSISKETLESTLSTIPAYLDSFSYAGCYYYYDRQSQTLKIYQDAGGPTVISDPTLIKQKLEEIQNEQIPANKDYIAFFEHNDENVKNLTFELFIRDGVLTPAAGDWATTPTETAMQEIVRNTLTEKFESLPSADASVYPHETIAGQGMWDGKLSTKDQVLLKWIAFGFGEFKYVINHAEINPELWKPDNVNYDLKPLTIMVPIAGAGDQTLAELKDLKELVELMATVLDDPKGTLEDIYQGLANIEPAEVPTLIFQSVADQWNKINEDSYEGQYQRARAGTQVTAVIIKLAASGAGIGTVLLPLMDKVQKILDFVRRFSNPTIKDKLTDLPTLQAEKFVDDFKDVGDGVIEQFDLKPGMVDAWNGILNNNLPDRTNLEVLDYIDEFSVFRNATPNQLLNDANNVNQNLFSSFRNNGSINRSNLLGFSYEGHLKNLLNSEPSFSISGKSFDGKYIFEGNEIWYEAKYRDFWENTALNNVNDWKSKFGSLKFVADSNGKSLEIITEGEIPEVFKEYFTVKGILYKENFN